MLKLFYKFAEPLSKCGVGSLICPRGFSASCEVVNEYIQNPHFVHHQIH